MNDDDTQELPDIRKLVAALSTDYTPALSPVEQALHWARNNGGIMSADILKAAVLELCAENEALKAELRKQGNVIEALIRARDRYLQRLTDVRAERDALKVALKPFADIGNDYADFILDETKFRNERDGWLDWFRRNVSMIRLFDLCQVAARALKADTDGA